MKRTIQSMCLGFAILTLLLNGCAPASTPLPPTITPVPTEMPQPTPTLQTLSKEALAGLIISSPILGSPYEVPGVQPPEMITPNGLGIINAKGQLIKFSDAGLFEGLSPSGVRIVYQHGFESDFTDYIDNLYIYNSLEGETIEILDDLENEGGKTVLYWSQDEQKVIYYNDYETVLFEEYGYFGAKQLLTADIKTGQAVLLINDGYQFDVSPDGTQIAYTTGEILEAKTNLYGGQPLEKFGCFQPHIYDIASSSSQPFDFSQLHETPVCLGYPKWSSDGKKLAWMAYFADDTFRPVIFNFQTGVVAIYNAMDQKPDSSFHPNSWNFGEYSDPDWVDNSIFWTPSYEVNIESGETSTPREMDLPYSPRSDKYIENTNGLFNVSLNEDRDGFKLSDINGNLLAFIFLNDIYDEPMQEIFTSDLVLRGETNIAGWSPFAPP